jgi:4-diphosphocytidyl-2-C-methyl-D-erythritol kinase
VLSLHSPAKVNLFLKVTGKRDDGYHALATLMQTVSLTDVLHLSLAQEDSLKCSDPALPTDASNLVLKAAELFRRKTGFKFGLKAELEKNIPSEAGLGGGSSNAATTLWGLNELFDRPTSAIELAQWAAEIGSDISFFLSQGTAFCTGRGEIVQEMPIPEPQKLWLVKPKERLSTPTVFKNVVITDLPERDYESYYYNDLELTAFKLVPSLAQLKENLLQLGFHTVVMTGTGSAFFCLGDANPDALSLPFSASVSYLNRSTDHWYNL